MLSEILFASVPTKREERGDRAPGLSVSQLYPCPYRLYKVHIGEVWEEELTPREMLNLSDGWDVEEQTVRRLAKAGIVIEDRTPSRRRVEIGKSRIPGSCDGTVTLNGKKYIWEHKAMNERNFWTFVRFGLRFFPGYKAQVNGYMLGKGLDAAIEQAKYKDANDYADIMEELDLEFIMPIIEWADRIRLEGWVPEPQMCKYCAYCGFNCFGEVLDFSWIGRTDNNEMAEKWKQGDKLTKVGEMLKDEARTYFVGKRDKDGDVLVEGIIGDKDLLLVEDLKIQKIIQHRFDVSKQRVLEAFGPEGLIQVGEERNVVTYRIAEV